MHKKKILIAGFFITIIFLMPFTTVAETNEIITDNKLENNCIDKTTEKTSIGKSELKILRSYQMWRAGENHVRIFFEIKNIGNEIFDGNIPGGIEMSPFFNPSEIIAHATGSRHKTINPGEKINGGAYLGFLMSDIPSGIFYVRCYINPTGDGDTTYGNKMTEIVLILLPPFIYFPFFRIYK